MCKEFVAFESHLRRSSYSTQDSVLSSLPALAATTGSLTKVASRLSGATPKSVSEAQSGGIKNKRQVRSAPAFDVLMWGFDLRSNHVSARKCDPACPRLALRAAKPHSLNHLASRAYEGIESFAVEQV
jgi:hypothetical protein